MSNHTNPTNPTNHILTLTVQGNRPDPGWWLANDAGELVARFATEADAAAEIEYPGDHVVLVEGGTLNQEYDRIRATWSDSRPQCEDCGADLTGADVHETMGGWVGDCCKAAAEAADAEYRAVSAAERRMGY